MPNPSSNKYMMALFDLRVVGHERADASVWLVFARVTGVREIAVHLFSKKRRGKSVLIFP